MMRLRAGLGVGGRADLLSYLLGKNGSRISIKEAAISLGYTEVALRSVAQDLVQARFIEEALDRPVRYRADREKWRHILNTEQPRQGEYTMPPWRHWREVFAFCTGVICWAREGTAAGWSSYLWSSRARDVTQRHQSSLERAEIRLPDVTLFPGESYLRAFSESVIEVAERMRREL